MDIRSQRGQDDPQAGVDALVVHSLLDHVNAQIREAENKLHDTFTACRQLPVIECAFRMRDEWCHFRDRIAPLERQRDWIIKQFAIIESLDRPQPTILIALDK